MYVLQGVWPERKTRRDRLWRPTVCHSCPDEWQSNLSRTVLKRKTACSIRGTLLASALAQGQRLPVPPSNHWAATAIADWSWVAMWAKEGGLPFPHTPSAHLKFWYQNNKTNQIFSPLSQPNPPSSHVQLLLAEREKTKHRKQNSPREQKEAEE